MRWLLIVWFVLGEETPTTFVHLDEFETLEACVRALDDHIRQMDLVPGWAPDPEFGIATGGACRVQLRTARHTE